MRHPLPLMTLALAAGIGLGALVLLPLEIPLCAAGLFLVVIFATKSARLFAVAVAVLFLCLGVLLITPVLHKTETPESITAYASKKGLGISGTVIEAPRMETGSTRIVLSDLMIKTHGSWRSVTGVLRLTVGERISTVSYGDSLFFVGSVNTPRNFNNPGGFDYEFFLARAGISATSYVDTGAGLLIRKNDPSFPLGFVEGVRNDVRNFFDTRFFSPEGAVIKAVVLGERGDIPEPLLDAYYRTGVGHVLAISGSNVGIVFIFMYVVICAFLVRCGRFPLRHSIRKWAALCSLFPVIAYTLLAGLEITVVRATLMICVLILAFLMEKERQVFNTLVLAAFVILICLPASLFDPSFQLSFVAVLSIIVIYPPVMEPVKRRFLPVDGVRPALFSRCAFRLIQFTVVSCAAIIGLLPFSAFYFHRITPLALPLNFVVVPLLGPVMTSLSLLSVPFIYAAPGIASWLSLVAAWAVSISNDVVMWADSLLPGGIIVFGPTALEIVLYYGLLSSIILFIRRRRWAVLMAGIVIAFMAADVAVTLWNRYEPRRLEATFLSVGNGDSCVIRLPGGRIMVVDGGPLLGKSFDVGESVISPFLLRERIRCIDYLVLSHPERDHAGGLAYLMKTFKVGELWITREAVDSAETSALVSWARSHDIPVTVIDSTTSARTIGPVSIFFLNPPPAPEVSIDLNNRSLVFRLVYGRFSLMMTGDVEKAGIDGIIARGDDISSVVLKAPHHGSTPANPPSLLRMTHPCAVVISCGYTNPFGFPGKTSLKRYHNAGCPVFRTDLDGAVTVTTDGVHVEIETMTGREMRQYISDDPGH